jgi:sec-independent protein translocase protein TatB
MFSWSELLLIAVVALIFIGPKELPQVLHSLGRAAARLRRSADDFRRQFEDSMRDSGYGDLHKNIQDIRDLNPANQLKNTIDRALNQDYHAPSAPAAPMADPMAQPEQKPAIDAPQAVQAIQNAAPSETGHAGNPPAQIGAAGPSNAAPQAVPAGPVQAQHGEGSAPAGASNNAAAPANNEAPGARAVA